jgi:hypothetical protein
MSRNMRTVLGRAFLALSAISLIVGIARAEWDTVPLAVVGIAGGLLLLNVRPDATSRDSIQHIMMPLAIGSVVLIAAMLVSQTAAAPYALTGLLILIGAAIVYYQLRRV